MLGSSNTEPTQKCRTRRRIVQIAKGKQITAHSLWTAWNWCQFTWRSASAQRIISGSQFEIVPKRSLSGEHVLVLDDTWTTGSRTQSAALTLHDAGADHVSVMVIGRWLSQTYGGNAEFIKTRLRRDYNPRICPVTGGDCP